MKVRLSSFFIAQKQRTKKVSEGGDGSVDSKFFWYKVVNSHTLFGYSEDFDEYGQL
jgi:hypothetical protein